MAAETCLAKPAMEPIHSRVLAKAASLANQSNELVNRAADVVGKIVGNFPPRDSGQKGAQRDGQIYDIDAMLDQIRTDIEDLFQIINALERGE